jgi:membrane-bound lytic murein transglycosylase A
MIAQDTGSAIVGAARADIFFGSGDRAGSMAGRVRHAAAMVALVPVAAAP